MWGRLNADAEHWVAGREEEQRVDVFAVSLTLDRNFNDPSSKSRRHGSPRRYGAPLGLRPPEGQSKRQG